MIGMIPALIVGLVIGVIVVPLRHGQQINPRIAGFSMLVTLPMAAPAREWFCRAWYRCPRIRRFRRKYPLFSIAQGGYIRQTQRRPNQQRPGRSVGIMVTI